MINLDKLNTLGFKQKHVQPVHRGIHSNPIKYSLYYKTFLQHFNFTNLEWLVNYTLIMGKIYIWDCRRKDIKPAILHFKQLLLNKYDTEKYVAKKQDKNQTFP